MKNGITSIFAIVLSLILAMPAHAGDSGWVPISAVKGYLAKLKRDKELPVAIDCRNDSKVAAAWKPFVRIQSKPNSSGTEWTIISTVDTRPWQPGNPLDKNRPKWRVISRKVVKGGSGGTILQCTIWHV